MIGHSGTVYGVALGSDNITVASCSSDRTIRYQNLTLNVTLLDCAPVQLFISHMHSRWRSITHICPKQVIITLTRVFWNISTCADWCAMMMMMMMMMMQAMGCK